MSVNAPLTPRRIGSLSTRTTDPYFLGLLQDVLESAGLPARICVNRRAGSTPIGALTI